MSNFFKSPLSLILLCCAISYLAEDSNFFSLLTYPYNTPWQLFLLINKALSKGLNFYTKLPCICESRDREFFFLMILKKGILDLTSFYNVESLYLGDSLNKNFFFPKLLECLALKISLLTGLIKFISSALWNILLSRQLE